MKQGIGHHSSVSAASKADCVVREQEKGPHEQTTRHSHRGENKYPDTALQEMDRGHTGWWISRPLSAAGKPLQQNLRLVVLITVPSISGCVTWVGSEHDHNGHILQQGYKCGHLVDKLHVFLRVFHAESLRGTSQSNIASITLVEISLFDLEQSSSNEYIEEWYYDPSR
jgi:hypothetical protein